MVDLAVSVTDSDADLAITEANGYRITSLTSGARVWIRNKVESPFMHGSTEVSKRLDEQTASLGVLVLGADLDQMAVRFVTLRDALEQSAYTLDLTFAGTLNLRWACTGADSSPGEGGSLDAADLLVNEQAFAFTIFRHPIPLAGHL